LRGRSPRSNAADLLREPEPDMSVVSPPSPLGVLEEAAPTNRPVGVYVHVPFCTRRCEYCSFNTAAVGDHGIVARYLAALLREIELLGAAPWARGLRVETIFLGGGTPSLLEATAMAAILGALRRAFAVDLDAEVTVECNPESVTREKLTGYRQAGVNRVSLGVQSLDDAILPAIGRLHTAGEARAAFERARGAGFSNVSVDLIYGLPGLTAEGFRATVDGVLAWEPEHLSAYGLTLDPGSVWGSSGIGGLPPEETVITHYWTMAERAASHGYEHYEISNYARPGCRSRHNMRYWRHREYLAFGPGGCGFVGTLRYANARATKRYCDQLRSGELPIAEHEWLTAGQREAERLILGLRTADGVPVEWLRRRAVATDLRTRIASWREAGLLRTSATRAWLTERGFLLSDALFVDLV
jgi:oxygen-independent coproporphyrinogen-3 oxidase